MSWNFSSFDKSLVERVNFRCCKSILQVSSTTGNNGARSEAGKLPLLYSLQKRSIKYWASIQMRPDSIIGRLITDETYQKIGIRKKIESDLAEAFSQSREATLRGTIAGHRMWFVKKFEAFWRQRIENSQKLKSLLLYIQTYSA